MLPAIFGHPSLIDSAFPAPSALGQYRGNCVSNARSFRCRQFRSTRIFGASIICRPRTPKPARSPPLPMHTPGPSRNRHERGHPTARPFGAWSLRRARPKANGTPPTQSSDAIRTKWCPTRLTVLEPRMPCGDPLSRPNDIVPTLWAKSNCPDDIYCQLRSQSLICLTTRLVTDEI